MDTGTGFLKVKVYAGNYVYPVQGARVIVTNRDDKVLLDELTDENGITSLLTVGAPDASLSTSPDMQGEKFTPLTVEVHGPAGFRPIIIKGVEIFDGITSTLPVQLEPKLSPEDNEYDEIVIPPEHGVDLPHGQENHAPESWELSAQQVAEQITNRALGLPSNIPPANEVKIPNFITVHLGVPTANARNVRVPFIDYIKNMTYQKHLTTA